MISKTHIRPATTGERLTCSTCCRRKSQKGTQTQQSTATDRHLRSSVSVGDVMSVYTCFPRIRTESSEFNWKRTVTREWLGSQWESLTSSPHMPALHEISWGIYTGNSRQENVSRTPSKRAPCPTGVDRRDGSACFTSLTRDSSILSLSLQSVTCLS